MIPGEEATNLCQGNKCLVVLEAIEDDIISELVQCGSELGTNEPFLYPQQRRETAERNIPNSPPSLLILRVSCSGVRKKE